MSQHDASYRQLFSSPHMVRCLFDGILQSCTDYGPGLPGANDLDWCAAQALPTSYIGKGLRRRQSDCVWRIPRRDGEDLYILLLLEHQSGIDTHMALRMLIYTGLLYQSMLKQNLIPPGERYPSVLPVVLYSGVTPWNAATRLIDNIDTSLPLRHLQPDIRYIVLDEGRMLRTANLPEGNLATLLFRLEHSQGVEDVRQLMQTIGKCTQDPCYDEVRRAFLDWATHVLLPRALDGQPTPTVHSLQEFDDMLAENTRSWTHQWKMEGRIEGRQEGRQEGEAALLQRQLVRKFGPLPEALQQRIQTATPNQLETWSLSILDAQTLDDVFAN